MYKRYFSYFILWRQFRNRSGFTLIEIMVAISILAILATIGMTTYSQVQLRGRDAKRKQDLRAIATAFELYYQKFKHYPCTSNWTSSSSASDPWIVNDYTMANCGDVTHLFDYQYISKVPKDPTHPTLDYQYFGRGDTYGAGCTFAAGQSYILLGFLENKNDPDRHQTKQYNICNTILNFGGQTKYNDAFVITVP
jgi:prepilin-type N-terminal cleavage/methylation domain-containing protein